MKIWSMVSLELTILAGKLQCPKVPGPLSEREKDEEQQFSTSFRRGTTTAKMAKTAHTNKTLYADADLR